jgi:hypothetical protein
VVTIDGVGEASITLDRLGQLEITASSDPATQSTTLAVTIHDRGSIGITTTVSALTTATGSNILGSTVVPTSSVIASATQGSAELTFVPRVTRSDIWIALLAMLVLNVAGDFLRLRGGRTRVYRLRLILIGLLCGLLGYVIYALGILGTWELWHLYREWGAVFFGIVFSVIPLLTVLIVQGIRATRRSQG